MSQLPPTKRRPLTEQDAVDFLDAVNRQFTEAPQYYDKFLDIMKDYREKR